MTCYPVALPYVDTGRIGACGIYGGGGYAINAAMTLARRIKALGMIVAAYYGRLIRENFSRLNPVAALEAMAAQRIAEVRGASLQIDDSFVRLG